MRMRFRRVMGAAALAVVLSLAFGVSVAAAVNSPVPVILGAVANPSSGPYEDALSGTIAVATQNTAQGWYAYAPAYYNNSLAAISMADPTHPALVGEAVPSDAGTQVFGASTVNVLGGVAYVASKNLNGTCVGSVGSSGCNANTYAPGGSEYGDSLSLFNVSANPAMPQFLGSISDAATPSNNLFGAYGVTATSVNGVNYAVVAAQGCLHGQPCPDPTVGNDLAMISLANPSAPQYTGSVNNATAGTEGFTNALDHPTAVAVSGNYAFVTSFYGNALAVVDISNPANPVVVQGIKNGTWFPAPVDIAIQGNYAYVANQNSNGLGQGTFTVVDISNPLNPKVVSYTNAIGLAGSYRLRVSGNTAYVASHQQSAITNVDITNPASPIVITSTVSRADLSGASGLDLMNIAGNEYVVASSPQLSSEPNYVYPPFPSFGNTTQTTTGTITALEIEAVPANSALPTVTGSTVAGSTLTANVGSWTGTAPFSYAFQWQRCDTAGANCTVLKTNTQNYPVGGSDVGHTLRVAVKATNGAASKTATSAATAVVTICPTKGKGPAYCALPKVRKRPTVTGTVMVGQRLVTNPGMWATLPSSVFTTAQRPTTRSAWLRCNAHGSHCKAIAKATHLTYRPTKQDTGHRLKLEVIATNRNGSKAATSAASAPVAAAGTKISLSLKASAQPKLVRKGSVVASVSSNVGALLDVFVAVKVGNGGASWTTGTPVEARSSAPLKFKVVLSRGERRRLRAALAAHKTIRAKVIGVRFINPGGDAVQESAPKRFGVTG